MNAGPVIGLEIHAQLSTREKLLCGCRNSADAPPNTQCCSVCLGLPGALPALSAQCVELAVRAALALGCDVHSSSDWARKGYFYPDLPKGYQITQHDAPLATGGSFNGIRIRRVHIEEDAARSRHTSDGRTLLDFNRAGVPLIEIVTEPDLRTPADAAHTMRRLRAVLRALDVCDGDLERGSMRCDANVSVRGGERVEIKNLNSFRFVQQALHFEIHRQNDVVMAGGVIERETRLWDPVRRETRPLRSKEELADYRFFPEPDLPPLSLEEIWLQRQRDLLPELPDARAARYSRVFGVGEDVARILADDAALVEIFEQAVAQHDNAQAIANWIVNDTLALEHRSISGAHLAELVRLVDSGRLTTTIAKRVFAEMARSARSPSAIIEADPTTDPAQRSVVQEVLRQVFEDHPEEVARARAGKRELRGFFVGQVMQRTRGTADPVLVTQLLDERLKR